jgi:hypothetical protein
MARTKKPRKAGPTEAIISAVTQKLGKARPSREIESAVREAVSAVMGAIGRKGGKRKVPKGFAMLSPEERSKRARDSAKKRWAKKTQADFKEKA